MGVLSLNPNDPASIDIYAPYGFSPIIDTLHNAFLEVLDGDPFVNILDIDPSLGIDLKYATYDNISSVPQYPESMKAILRREVAIMLKEAQAHLKSIRWTAHSLLIYDAWRPQSVQEKMYAWCEKNKKEWLFADPKKGSIHTFGCAVDLTITNNGQPLDMGAPFDDASDIAMPKNELLLFWQGRLTQSQIENREILRRVMGYAGFSNIDIEWWHFETPDDEDDFGRRTNIRRDLPRITSIS